MSDRFSEITVDGISSTVFYTLDGDIEERVFRRPMFEFLYMEKYHCQDYDAETQTCACYSMQFNKREWWKSVGVKTIEGSTWSDIMKAPQDALMDDEVLREFV